MQLKGIIKIRFGVLGMIQGISVLIKYYTYLFSSSYKEPYSASLDHIPYVITDKMNLALTGTFSEAEVSLALKQMAYLKALGPDGIPPLFYQHFWGVVDYDVTSSLLSWLNSGTLPHPINHTFITLIPKTKNPEHVQEYCPISLCNVLYKIFSKVLANKLKKILPTIITKHQFAFVKDKLITDNILITFESLHCMRKYNSGNSSFMAIKLDMSKAYDRVEWLYLENLMRRMGFNEKWIGLVMVCVKIVTYLILVNREPQGLLQTTKGIRQGDPLSHFLFLLCTEDLHGLIQQTARVGNIKGFFLCR